MPPESLQGTSSDPGSASELPTLRPVRRPFCQRCKKAQKLCICSRFKCVVRNKTKITILQSPQEKNHAVGSVRVAMLGLENVALVDVPEIDYGGTFRIRPKVEGSKRCLEGRGGKKLLLQASKPELAHGKPPSQSQLLQIYNLLADIFGKQLNVTLESFSVLMHPGGNNDVCPKGEHSMHPIDCINRQRKGNETDENLVHPGDSHTIASSKSTARDDSILSVGCSDDAFDAWIPPGVALLFPSDKAVELSEDFWSMEMRDGLENYPSHLIVLDGTWSKAKRIYFDHPWLQRLPHYKICPSTASLYTGVRKEPKPDCLSTIESIVFALKVLEPETEGLDGLLEVFDSMVEDQRQYKEMKFCASLRPNPEKTMTMHPSSNKT